MTERLGGFRGTGEPFDGVAEIWYESQEALDAVGRSPEGRAASRELLEDERRFLDLAESRIWIAEEIKIISGSD